MKKIFVFSSMISMLLIVGCDREISVTPADPPPASGKLIVQTIPEGYEIYLNDRISGQKTPHTFEFMEQGFYDVSLHHPLYVDTSSFFGIHEDEEVTLNYDCESHPKFRAKLTCLSVPNKAEIFINDTSTGKYTPYVFPHLYPGETKISIGMFGFRSHEKVINIKSGDELQIRAFLEDTTLWINYNTDNSPIPTNNITCAFYGYYGSSDKGVIFSQGSQMHPINASTSSLNAYNINAISFMPNNQRIVATNNGAFFSSNYVFWTDVNTKFPDFKEKSITDVYSTWMRNNETSPYRTIIATSSAGAFIMEGDQLTQLNHENSSLPDNVTCVSLNSDGGIAIGSYDKGLFIRRKNSTEWINITAENSILESNFISDVSMIYGSNILVGITTGNLSGKLYSLIDEDITEINVDNNRVYSICHRPPKIWVGTSGGIYYITPWKRKHYTTENSPLPTNFIYDLLDFDYNDELQIATNHGIVRYLYGRDPSF